MSIRTIAAAAALGCLLAGCQPASQPAGDSQPVADRPADPTAPDPFATAVNFECDGGGKLDIVFQGGSPSALVRIDGGTPMTLSIDEAATSGMIYKDATTSLNMEGDRLVLASGGSTKTCAFVPRDLPAPAVEGVVRDLTSADAGASVEMKVGEKISVSLSGVPTAGYLWAADNPPAFVKVSDGPGGSTSTAQFLPGFAGGNHWEVLVIEAVAAGESEISLVQKRPWETQAAPDDQRFRFRLKVK
jgi:predicted secreted protein